MMREDELNDAQNNAETGNKKTPKNYSDSKFVDFGNIFLHIDGVTN